MKEKEPKSPVLVVGTILFLSLFIILPPTFRTLFPKKEEVVQPIIEKGALYCEKTSVNEKLKVMMMISYENAKAVNNQLTFLTYTPTEDEILEDAEASDEDSLAKELLELRGVKGVVLEENVSQTVITLTRDIISNNADNEELKKYLLDMTAAKKLFEGHGYMCSEIEY